MKISKAFNEKIILDVARACGSDSVKSGVAYLRKAKHDNPSNFICEIIDDCCFWSGTICKNHFRLYELATSVHNKGYGTYCIYRMKKFCKNKGLKKITFRCNKQEGACEFYKRFGGRIIGDKKTDWEMEIIV